MNLGKDEASAGPFVCSSDCLAICVHELRETFRSPWPLSLGNSTPELGSPGDLRDAFLFLSGRQTPDRLAYQLAGLKASWIPIVVSCSSRR